MRLLALLLALAAPLSARARTAESAPATPASAPTPAAPATPVPPAAPAAAPVLPTPAVAPAVPTPAVPTPAVAAKLAEGDRLALGGDQRGALFAYLDALYAQPSLAAARLRVGRAYLALRYPARALEQAELVLAAEPDHAEARKLLEDAKAAAARVGASQASAAAAAPVPGAEAPARPAPRVYKLTPDGGAATAPAAAAPAPAASPPPERPPVSEAGAQHYRTALGLLQSREWAKAIAELTSAVEADPKLAVAWSARGSAHFGLARYQEAADDYQQAIDLDPKLGTPLYGLAECYRQLGNRDKAVEAYQRYASSTAPDVRDDLRALAARRAQELR